MKNNWSTEYAKKRFEIESQIQLLQSNLDKMDKEQKDDQNNYGYVGNCGHALELLDNLNSFLK